MEGVMPFVPALLISSVFLCVRSCVQVHVCACVCACMFVCVCVGWTR